MSAPSAFRDSQYGLIWANTAPGSVASTFTSVASLASTASIGLPQEETVVTFDWSQNLRKPLRFSGQRVPLGRDLQNDIYGVAPKCTITAPITYNTTGTTESGDMLLAGMTQFVSEGATTPYVKTFRYPLQSEVPDFSASDGAYFALVEERNNGANDIVMYSCSPVTSRLSCYPGQNQGRLYVSHECIGRYLTMGVTYTGTMSFPTAYTYFNFNQLQVSTFDTGSGATAVTIYGFEITSAPGIKSIPTSGYVASGYSEVNRAVGVPQHLVTGSIDVLWDSTAETTIKAIPSFLPDSGNKLDITLGWYSGTVDTTGELGIVMHVIPTGYSWVGQEESVARITFEGYYTSSGPYYPLQIQYANSVDRGAAYTGAGTFWV